MPKRAAPSRHKENGSSAILTLQATAGNRAVVQLLRQGALGGTPIIRRAPGAGLLTKPTDLDQLAGIFPTWEPEQTKQVARHLGVMLFRSVIKVFGSAEVARLGADEWLQVETLGDVAVLTHGTVEKVLELGRRWPVPLTTVLAVVVNHFPKVTYDQLRPSVVTAPPPQKAAAAKDGALLARARNALDRETYLNLLPALGVHEAADTELSESPGVGKHLTGREADRYIRNHLAAYLTEAIKAGRKVDGEVSVVGDEDFQLAFDRQWVDTGLLAPMAAETACNAFVDVNLPKRHIWVNRNLGNLGTVIHEGMHKYANATLRKEQMRLYPGVGVDSGISQLDEGITEFFTREITHTIHVNRGNYQRQFKLVKKLAARSGTPVLAKAYFDGDFGTLKGTLPRWDDFAKAIEEKRWDDAKAFV